jgi:hypothetical protein
MYFICGDKLLAFNAKCATSTFCWAIIRQYYPETLYILENKTQWANGRRAEDQQHHRHVPTRATPYKHQVAQIVREPVDRFCSAAGFMNLTNRFGIEPVLNDLVNETSELEGIRGTIAANIHFKKQSRFSGDITYFRMNQLQECADFLGLKVPLKTINTTRHEKPVLTPKQKDLVRDFYADDVALWESIQE